MKAILASLFLAICASSGFGRTFTSNKGQTVEGHLSRADSKNAYILTPAGKKLTIPLTSLSEADRKFCEEWRVANPDIRLKVRAEAFTAKGTRNTSNETTGAGDNTTVRSRTRTTNQGYRVTLSNWSSDPGAKLDGLTVEYAIVVGWMDTAAEGDKRGVKDVHKGTLSVPELNGTKEVSVNTTTVGTGQSAALATRTSRTTSGSTSTSEAGAVYRESMDGIALLVKREGKVVASYVTGKVPKEVQIDLAK